MHYKHRQQATGPMRMRRCGAIRPGGRVLLLLLLLLLETDKRPRVTRARVTLWFGWFFVFGWRRVVLLSLSAKQLVKSTSAFFVRFPLASSTGRSPHTTGPLPGTAASCHASSHEEGLPTRKTLAERPHCLAVSHRSSEHDARFAIHKRHITPRFDNSGVLFSSHRMDLAKKMPLGIRLKSTRRSHP